MIYLILPIYNEEENLRVLIPEIYRLMKGREYKIIAVNDGSRDNSLGVLEEIRNDNLVIENCAVNMNIGSVFSTAIDRVLSDSSNDSDTVIIMESDQTNSVFLINVFLAEISGNDIVIASRYKKGGGYVNFPLGRNILSHCANRLVRFCFPVKGVFDYTIFFRAYRVGILKEAMKYFGRFGLIQSEGFAANIELLLKLAVFTDDIHEIPYVYDYGARVGKSKIKILSTIKEYLYLIFYLKRTLNKIESQKA